MYRSLKKTYILLPPFHMYSRPEGRTTVREPWTVVRTTIFPVRTTVFCCRTTFSLCPTTQVFSFFCQDGQEILSGQPKNGRGQTSPMSRRDSACTTLKKLKRLKKLILKQVYCLRSNPSSTAKLCQQQHSSSLVLK